ncbi:MAG: 4a-hydroxytetrahydrobiopterin dehydratase [Euryarchaeota archaeon]|nr:4a-hydroxytetrahydrobiopterin dehydratase [Euryarchaeota archaeon]
MTERSTTQLRPPEPWTRDDGQERIGLEVKTKDFLTAIGIVNEVARIAEEEKHHPDLHIEGWNTLRIETYTHTEGKVTKKDIKLAERISALLTEKGLA